MKSEGKEECGGLEEGGMRLKKSRCVGEKGKREKVRVTEMRGSERIL